MFQVRIYILTLRKYPKRGKGYYAYRLETVTGSGKVHEKEVYEEELEITANQLALVAMYHALEELKCPCEVEIYTDSLYLRSNYVDNLQTWAENGTANQLALVAMYHALEELKCPCEVEIYTDSLYLRSNYVDNLQTWAENGWKNAKKEKVANEHLWKEIYQITRKHVIRFNAEYQWSARARMTHELLERRMNDVG